MKCMEPWETSKFNQVKKSIQWDFPGSPVVKTSLSNAGGAGSIPGQGAKIPHALGSKNQNIKQKQYCNKFNKDLRKKKVYAQEWNTKSII